MSRSPLFHAMRRLAILGRPHWPLLMGAFVCMAVVAVTTGAYAWLMGPALRFLLSGGEAGLPLVARLVPSVSQWPRDTVLWALPAVVIIVGVFKGLAYLGQFFLVGYFGQRVVVDLRREVFQRLLGLSPLQLSSRMSGDLLSRFSSDVAAVELAATYSVASWLRDSLQVVVLAGAAVALEWRLALFSLAVAALGIWPASRFTRSVVRRARESQAGLGELAAQVQEGLGAIRTVQAFNAEGAEAARFGLKASSVARALARQAWSRAAVPAAMELLAASAIAACLAWAAASQAIEPDTLVSFIAALVFLYQPVKDLGRLSQFAVTAGAALERIEELLSLRPAVPDRPHASRLDRLTHGIVVDDIHFAWGERAALHGVSLTIPVGKVTALVGESGSGKSTLVSLLLRFERPQSGRFLIDGVDADSLQVRSIRAHMALVTQEALLFSASVLENLRLAKPRASAEEIEAAAQAAQAHDFVTALPQGYHTPIGERGATLSGGQKQRLCLARAILAGAELLVLDEATSNLDPRHEREVQLALETVLKGRTALVVAHRLSTVCMADHIVVLAAGRVVEQGTHAELLERRGVYADMWERQRVTGSTAERRDWAAATRSPVDLLRVERPGGS